MIDITSFAIKSKDSICKFPLFCRNEVYYFNYRYNNHSLLQTLGNYLHRKKFPANRFNLIIDSLRSRT